MSEDVLEVAQAWREDGHDVALAVVTASWGSSPRPAGAVLAVRGDGAFRGSVSGGCVEGAVIAEARAALGDGAPRRLGFDVSDERAWELGLPCGGRIAVFIAPVA